MASLYLTCHQNFITNECNEVGLYFLSRRPYCAVLRVARLDGETDKFRWHPTVLSSHLVYRCVCDFSETDIFLIWSLHVSTAIYRVFHVPKLFTDFFHVYICIYKVIHIASWFKCIFMYTDCVCNFMIKWIFLYLCSMYICFTVYTCIIMLF